MRLFLSSTLDGSIDLFMKEYGLEPESTPVVYIPTAENCFRPPRRVEDRGSYQCLIERGFPVEVCDLDSESHESITHAISRSKVIVVAGGNTYYLLYHMKRAGFDRILRTHLDRGLIYVGSSAGSCVCSPDISYVGLDDDPSLAPDLPDRIGLHLVDFAIYPHRTDNMRSTPSRIYLSDNQAVIVDDSAHRIVSC